MQLVKRYPFSTFGGERLVHAGRGGSVQVEGLGGLSPKKARRLAKQLKKAARHVEKGA